MVTFCAASLEVLDTVTSLRASQPNGGDFGHELLAQAPRHACELDYRSFNFLRGEEPYKFEWGAQRREKVRVTRREL